MTTRRGGLAAPSFFAPFSEGLQEICVSGAYGICRLDNPRHPPASRTRWSTGERERPRGIVARQVEAQVAAVVVGVDAHRGVAVDRLGVGDAVLSRVVV